MSSTITTQILPVETDFFCFFFIAQYPVNPVDHRDFLGMVMCTIQHWGGGGVPVSIFICSISKGKMQVFGQNEVRGELTVIACNFALQILFFNSSSV